MKKIVFRMCFLFLSVSLILGSIPSYAGKPGGGPSPTLTLTALPNSVSATTNQSISLSIQTSDFKGDLVWKSSTTLGSLDMPNTKTSTTSISPHTNVLTFKSSISGTGTITVSVQNPTNRKITATVKIPVSVTQPSNLPPFIDSTSDLNGTINEDTAFVGTVKATDSDGDVLTYAVTKNPANGSVVIDVSGHYVYTPALNFFGTDVFTIGVSDSKAVTSAVVNLTIASVDDPAIAKDDAVNTLQDSAIIIDVLSNDVDPDSTLSIDQVTVPPLSGNAVITNGKIIYTPNLGFKGIDSFEYTVLSGNAPAKVTIIVTSNAKLDKYVSLGDSIATGTTGQNGTHTPFSQLFYNYLEGLDSSITVTFKDFARADIDLNGKPDGDGDTTTDLLATLQNTDVRSHIADADVITISIGGNNLMQAALESNNGGIDTNPWTTYDFSRLNLQVAENGRAAFENDWNVIIKTIKDLNPKAQLIVLTVYNPYNLTDNTNYHPTVDKYLYGYEENGLHKNGINEILYANRMTTSSTNYVLADIANVFHPLAHENKMGTMTHFYESLFGWPSNNTITNFSDPHPNVSGQNAIYNLTQSVFDKTVFGY